MLEIVQFSEQEKDFETPDLVFTSYQIMKPYLQNVSEIYLSHLKKWKYFKTISLSSQDIESGFKSLLENKDNTFEIDHIIGGLCEKIQICSYSSTAFRFLEESLFLTLSEVFGETWTLEAEIAWDLFLREIEKIVKLKLDTPQEPQREVQSQNISDILELTKSHVKTLIKTVLKDSFDEEIKAMASQMARDLLKETIQEETQKELKLLKQSF